MQVTETLSQGLKREFQVVLPAAELEERLTSELATLKDKVRLNGFRPGKVPVAHLRKRLRPLGHGRRGSERRQRGEPQDRRRERPQACARAAGPASPRTRTRSNRRIDAKADLAFKVALEVLPSFELADLSDVSVRRPVAEVADAEVEEALERMAAQNRPFAAKAAEAGAETGDRVVVDFIGRIDGEAFEGGKGEGIQVELGSGSFIPGFEEQLVGAKAGESRAGEGRLPAELRRRAPRRQGRRVRRRP